MPHRRLVPVCWLLFAAVVAGFAPRTVADDSPAAAGHPYDLFDGQSLFGWTVENGCQAKVQDGQLLLEAGDGWLRSDHEYTDFKLHVEWKALQPEGYDAGIYLRAGREGAPFPKTGYQVNMLQGKEGDIGRLPGASSTGLANPAGEWNTFDITVIGDTVETVINNKPAYKATGLTIPAGHVGIQVEVPKGGQFLLRNIRITELTHRSLFNGRDFTGWEGAGQPAETCWVVEDGTLTCTGKKGPWLRSAEEFDDFNLRLEYQVAEGGNSGLYIRVPENGNHHRSSAKAPEAGFEIQLLDDHAPRYANLKDYQYTGSIYDIVGASPHVGRPAGNWNTIELNCRGQHVRTTHNGVVVVDATAEAYPLLNLRKLKGYLGLQNHSSVVRFRNIRIGAPME